MDAQQAYRRDRGILIAALVALTLLAWGYMVAMPELHSPSANAVHDHTSHASSWRASDLLFAFAMWSVMMVGMMLPAASPAILAYSATAKRAERSGASTLLALMFVAGYLLVWTGFSGVAALLQWTLHQAALLTPEGASAGLGGLLFLTAGIFQWTPLKKACLNHCRSPLLFVMNSWRDGATGAISMGVQHGLYCLGCCWALMVLMLAVGVMDLVWTALLTGFLIVEKILPAGDRIGRAAGVLFATIGVFWLGGALFG
jgi:predicted metal-binding membrane protein